MICLVAIKKQIEPDKAALARLNSRANGFCCRLIIQTSNVSTGRAVKAVKRTANENFSIRLNEHAPSCLFSR
jgi:hypothetical protein